ncbi:MAG: 50S ribosomal protein L15 [Candidatus Levybacteria bacterium CG_4_9_14_3_um_filter_35_16]|nr:MAG: 50S ribosomal protein L15 [Candidatus Levybacteria bacterium CG22_combo_CG10-13_8_21_14_all_35_11]PIY93856.1 MAG: 50S ribosomal protein L15 [Candidatus Levybacteria bacterium CG_4_10_14_0_8_um_filter_35_23]PJA00187.1 MAG: 50S ribosomal protein L15 [Candidatus Levybacteria bacterium CG_4_10_14_0_2_um_filter_35_8]PJA91349.1 MAG: 50S ribosomal protein L15 [Candidatus Levybacteria bacterium CG_4_9_14_3_um_filter_35_16]PJC54788.1 MAG: 50S ribosomal protein L15 [Candidatus Levybacteria bacter
MSALNELKKIKSKTNRRLGQGHGSGRVKTSGRGTKGQKSRNKVPIYFEGGGLPLIKRLPFHRGKGKNKVFKKKPIGINVKVLNLLKKDSVVDIKALVENNIVVKDDAKTYGVKILGDGELTISLIVKLPVTKGAEKKILKAGGHVERDTPEVSNKIGK